MTQEEVGRNGQALHCVDVLFRIATKLYSIACKRQTQISFLSRFPRQRTPRAQETAPRAKKETVPKATKITTTMVRQN